MTTHVMEFCFLKKDTGGFVNIIKFKYVNHKRIVEHSFVLHRYILILKNNIRPGYRKTDGQHRRHVICFVSRKCAVIGSGHPISTSNK